MPTSTAAAIPCSLDESVIAKVDSIEMRSDAIAKLASRMSEIPKDVIRQLLTPHASHVPDSYTDPLVPLISELIKASSTNEPETSKVSDERNLAISTGLAVSLRWLYRAETILGDSLTERILLKTLIPVYLAAGQGRAGTGIADTVSLIRTTCMILELNRLVIENEFSEWLRDSSRSTIDPHESIPNSFQISLPKMANSFWREIAANSKDIPQSSIPTF